MADILCKYYDNFLCWFLTSCYHLRSLNIDYETFYQKPLMKFIYSKNEINYWRIFLLVQLSFVLLRSQLNYCRSFLLLFLNDLNDSQPHNCNFLHDCYKIHNANPSKAVKRVISICHFKKVISIFLRLKLIFFNKKKL